MNVHYSNKTCISRILTSQEPMGPTQLIVRAIEQTTVTRSNPPSRPHIVEQSVTKLGHIAAFRKRDVVWATAVGVCLLNRCHRNLRIYEE
jgi:hypothetical protein